jgi:hypothetical protein
MYYKNCTNRSMDERTQQDVSRVCFDRMACFSYDTTLTSWQYIRKMKLDRSQKEKHAMYVDDLYVILHAFWVDDSRPLLGFFRIQVSLLLLLCAVTASRPGAIVEGASAKGSNKALLFKHIELIKVRTIEDASKSTIVANVTLENVKNKETSGKPYVTSQKERPRSSADRCCVQEEVFLPARGDPRLLHSLTHSEHRHQSRIIHE